mgnify:CR=1 FL=1
MKQLTVNYALSFFIIGAIAIMIILLWVLFFLIYIFQEPQIASENMGSLLEVSRYKAFWLIVSPLAIYSLALYALSKSSNEIKNPRWLLNAMKLRGLKTIFAFLAIIPLLVIKLVRVIWQTKIAQNTRSFSREVMESFS